MSLCPEVIDQSVSVILSLLIKRKLANRPRTHQKITTRGFMDVG